MQRQLSVSWSPRFHEYIQQDYLYNLAKYKYSGVDAGIISRYIMQPYWNFIINLVPMTVAPNAITLTGFLIGLSSSLLIMFYYFFSDAVYPAWVWYYAAFAIFLYQTLDAIDGKQARRTNTGSPLGELFDHGCDALLTPFVQLNVCCAVNTPPIMAFAYMAISSCVLFGAIWEQYITGTLELSYFSGPTDGILAACVVFIITGLFSPSVWDSVVVGPYEVLPFQFSESLPCVISTARSIVFVLYAFGGAITLGTNIFHVLTRPNIQARCVPLLTALPMLILLLLHICLFVVYQSIYSRYPFALEMSFAFLSSYTVTRMTVSRLCAMPHSIFNGYYLATLFVTLGALVAHTYLPQFEAKYLIPSLGSATVALAVLGVWQYVHMIVSVFMQLSCFLHIPLLSISSHHGVGTKRD
ncbi:putative ethanolaminephosphotransferase [Trypanosoma vivax]|nr:putative ethanolaminephosphotransferase [Trypanosoma vivax]